MSYYYPIHMLPTATGVNFAYGYGLPFHMWQTYTSAHAMAHDKPFLESPFALLIISVMINIGVYL